MAGQTTAEVQNMVFAGASLDRSVNPIMTQGFSRLDGVDAREMGSLRKFSGFTKLQIPFSFTDGALGFVKEFEIQKGNENGKLRGIITLDTTNNVLSADFYDTISAVWRHENLATNATGTADDIDVTSSSKFIYFTYNNGSAVVQRVFYFDSINSTFNSEIMGVVYKDNDTLTGTTATNASGLIKAGIVQVAFRLVNRRRNVKTGLSFLKAQTVSADEFVDYSAVTSTLPTDWATADTDIEFFRSVTGGNRLYLERVKTGHSTTAGDYTWGKAADGGLPDAQLVFKNDLYEPVLDDVGLPPATNRLAHYQGITVMRLIGDEVSHSLTDLVFSPSHDFRPEDFPRKQIYRLDSDLGPIIQFVRAGDFLVAFTPVAMLRFQKAGTQFTVNTVHFGWGPKSRSGMVAVGSSVVVVSTKGIYITNANDGSISTMGAVDRLITNENEWVADIDADLGKAIPNIHCATDEGLGATFIVNNVKKEAIVFWHASQRLTKLVDFPWNFSMTMVHPVDGGPRRAFFMGPRDAAGTFFQQNIMWSADINRTGDLTMLGINKDNNTLNGTLTSAGTSTQLIDTAGAWDQDVLGATAYIFTRDSDGNDKTPSKATLTTSGESSLVSEDMSSASNFTVEEREPADIDFNVSFLGRTVMEMGNNGLGGAGGADEFRAATYNVSTFSNTDEVYEVRATVLQWYDTVGKRIDSFGVWGRLGASTGMLASNHTAELSTLDGYGAVIVWTDHTQFDGTLLKGTNATLYILKAASGTITVLASDDSTLYSTIPNQGQWTLGLRFNGTTITAHFNGVQKLSVTDSSHASGSAAVFQGATNAEDLQAAGEGLMVDKFEVVKIAGATTITLDAAITGKATGDRYTISPVSFRVTFPPVGGSDKLFRRTSITSLVPFISNIIAPSATDNSKLRVQAFRAGSETEEVGDVVSLSTVVADMAGRVLAHGLGVQGGLEYHEAGGDFELLSVRVMFEQGDSTVI